MKSKVSLVFLIGIYSVIISSVTAVAQKQLSKYAFIIGCGSPNANLIQKTHGLQLERIAYQDLVQPIAKDIASMRKILKGSGYSNDEITVLSEGQITVKLITDSIKKIASKLPDSTLFVLYFSGHGQQIIDEGVLDELDDKLDETLVLSDDLLVDDTINFLYKNTLNRFKNVFLIDACFSGTVANLWDDQTELERLIAESMEKNVVKSANYIQITRIEGCASFKVDEKEKQYSLIYFSAASDSQTATAKPKEGSWFTQALYNVFESGDFKKLDYPSLFCRIHNMAKDDKELNQPTYSETGKVSSYAATTPLNNQQ